MKYIATSIEYIHSKKDNKDYVKVNCLKENGLGYELFTSKENFEKLDFPIAKVLDKKDLEVIFSEIDTIEIGFNERGFPESVE